MSIDTHEPLEDLVENNTLEEESDDLTNELEPWHTEEE